MTQPRHRMTDKLYAEANAVTRNLRTLTDAADLLATQDCRTLTKLWHKANITKDIDAAAAKAREVMGAFRVQQAAKLAPVGRKDKDGN